MLALTLGLCEVRRPRRTAQIVVTVCASMALLCAVAAAETHEGRLDALQAAGAFKGGEIAGVGHYVSALEGNLVWLGGTAMGLVIAVVGIMFMAGHSRAHDIAIKTIAGLAILASISGIVA